MGFFDRLKKYTTPVITQQEEHEIMHEAITNVSLEGRHEGTKKLLSEVAAKYQDNTNLEFAKKLDKISLDEVVHDVANGTRESISKPMKDLGTTYDILINKYLINADYRLEVLNWLEKLFLSDEHLGNAVKKIVRMLSTDYTLDLKYENNRVLKTKMLKILENVSFGEHNSYRNTEKTVIETNKGVINNMALQLILSGTISRMILTDKNKVCGTAVVNTKHILPLLTKNGNIEWLQKYESNQGRYEYLIQMQHDAGNIMTDTGYVVNPHRGSAYNPNLQDNNILTINDTKYLELSNKRFIYTPCVTLQDNPIAIPPLLNVISAHKLERTMIGGVAAYAERFNAVSFLTVLIRPVTSKNGESKQAYKKRVNELIERVTDKIDNGFKNGYFIGFKDVHDININATQSDAVGFNTLYKWAIINKASGLGVPPLLLGVETQVSESLARILVQTMMAELQDYQDCIADALHKFFMLYLQLNHSDYYLRMKKNNTVLKINFGSSTVQDKLRFEQAKALELNRVISMVNQGFISNEQGAKMLGLEKSYLKNPPDNSPQPNKPLAKKKKDEPNTQAKPARGKINEFKEQLMFSLTQKGLVNKDIFWEKGCQHDKANWSHKQFSEEGLKKELFRLVEEIQKEVIKENVKYTSKINGLISEFLDRYSESVFVSYESFITDFLEFLQSNFFTYFDYDKISQTMVDKFKKKNFNTILKVTGATPDFLNESFHTYFKNVSNHYLGKFISNPATISAINNYLFDKVVTNEIIVFSDQVLDDIRNLPNVVLPKQDYQLKRIVATTVSKYQNAGSVLAMQSIGVTKIQVVSLMAANTCGYCKALNGTTFETSSIANRYQQTINTNQLEDLQLYTPFVTSLYPKPSAMPTNSSLLAMSGVVIPFHPHCQCVYEIYTE